MHQVFVRTLPNHFCRHRYVEPTEGAPFPMNTDDTRRIRASGFLSLAKSRRFYASAENAGRLTDLDQVPVGIADIGADLAPVVLGLGEEFDALG